MSRRILIHSGPVLLTVTCIAVLLAACGARTPAASPESNPAPTGGLLESPLPTPVVLGPLTLEPSMGGVTGQIVASPPKWQGQAIVVYLAAYYEGTADQGGFYMIEPSQAPSTTADSSGAFQLGNIPPHKYVIAIGPDVEAALVIRQDGNPQVFTIVAGEVLDLGRISLP